MIPFDIVADRIRNAPSGNFELDADQRRTALTALCIADSYELQLAALRRRVAELEEQARASSSLLRRRVAEYEAALDEQNAATGLLPSVLATRTGTPTALREIVERAVRAGWDEGQRIMDEGGITDFSAIATRALGEDKP